MGPGDRFSSPRGSGHEPGRLTVFGEFQAENLASSSNDLQELCGKWNIKLGGLDSRVVTYLCKQSVWTSKWHGRRLARMWRHLWEFCTAVHIFVWALGAHCPQQMMHLLISLQTSLCTTFLALVVWVYHSIFIQILVMGSKRQARNLEWIIACQSDPESSILVSIKTACTYSH